jgi:PAS domain S-box-containing protein
VVDTREETLRSSLDAHDEAFFRMRSVRDTTGQIINFRYEYCNRAALAVLGRHRDDVIGSLLLDVFPSHRTNGLFDAYTRVVESGESLRYEFAFDEGGVIGEYEVVVSRSGDGYVLTGHDISDRKRLERDLKTLNDQLQIALTSRIMIEQAKGFVAAQAGTDTFTAFQWLRRYARDHNERIGVVAQSVVAGEIQLIPKV